VLFVVDVRSVMITDSHPVRSAMASMSVCFDCGQRVAVSGARQVRLPEGEPTAVEFHESLSLVTAMAHDAATGTYVEKLGKLVVRCKSPAVTGGTGFRGLGMATLPLHRLVANFQAQQFNIPLTNNAQGVGKITVVISSKPVGEVGAMACVCVCALAFPSCRGHVVSRTHRMHFAVFSGVAGRRGRQRGHPG
jgi:hypothetical protein